MAFEETDKEIMKPTVMRDESPLENLMKEILELKLSRNNLYYTSPMNILPRNYWTAQIVIKAMRAEQSREEDRCIEELKDVVVYSLLEILRLRGMKV